MNLKKLVYVLSAFVLFIGCTDDEDAGLRNFTVEQTEDSYRLEWDGGDYNDMVYRSTGSAEPVFYAEPDNVIYFEDYALQLGTTYNYQIVRHDEDGTPTDMSTEVISVDCEGFEPNITNLEISKGDTEPRHADITWNAYFIRDITDGHYIKVSIKREDDMDFNYLATVDDVTTEGNYVDEYALNPGHRVDYKVSLFDGNDTEISSVDDFIRVEHNYDLVPTNLSVSISSVADQAFHVSWDPAADAEEYTIQFKVNDEGWSNEYNAGTATEGELTIDGTLEDGDLIQVVVTGHKDEYSEDSEIFELTW